MYLLNRLAVRQHKNIKSRKKEIELVLRARAGDKRAENRLYRGCIRFLISIVKKYDTNNFIESEDFYQQACLGFSRAIKKFDINRNVKFISYMVWWARAYVNQYLVNTYSVTIPPNFIALRRKWFQTYDFEPEVDSPEFIEFCTENSILTDPFIFYVRCPSMQYSLDQPTEFGKGTYKDFLNDKTDFTDAINNKELNKIIQFGLSKLNSDQKKVLTGRYGLGDSPKYDEASVAAQLGVTRQRISQIEQAALKKLKNLLIREKITESFSY